MTIIEYFSNQYKNITSTIPSWLGYLLRGIVSIGLIGWLVLGFNWKNVWTTIVDIPFFFIMGWLLIWLVGYCLMALRFKKLLAAQDINLGFFYSIQIMFIGAFSGNFMPSSMGGDVFKFVYLARAGYGKSVTSTSVVVDRLLHSIATLLFLPFIFTLPGLLLDSKLRIPSLTPWLIGIVIFGVISIVILTLWLRKSSLSVPWVSVLITRVRSIVLRLKTIFLKWTTHPGTFGFAMILSILVIFLFSLAGWVVARGMDIEISLLTWFAIQACLSVLAFLPISLNGLGVQEVGLVYLLSLVGVSEEKGLALSLLLRALIVLFSLFGAYGVIVENKKSSTTKNISK